MTERIACSCVSCPKCGTWVVVGQQAEPGAGKEKFRASCPAPECGKEFDFGIGEIRVFELPLLLFDRRHSYPIILKSASCDSKTSTRCGSLRRASSSSTAAADKPFQNGPMNYLSVAAPRSASGDRVSSIHKSLQSHQR